MGPYASGWAEHGGDCEHWRRHRFSGPRDELNERTGGDLDEGAA